MGGLVGDPEFSFEKICTVLVHSCTLITCEKLIGLGSALQVESEVMEHIKRHTNLPWSLAADSKLLRQILQNWRSTKGDKATFRRLIRVLRRLELNEHAAKLRKEFISKMHSIRRQEVKIKFMVEISLPE